MFKIVWSNIAFKQLSKLPRILSKKIFSSIEDIAKDPLRGDIKKLQGSGLYRMRIGDYRVIFELDKSNSLINILKIGHRKNIYKNI